ncbi:MULTISPECIES: ZIP family metal transporter [Bradyrhizobium]|uniref:ZIP family metal transporter n=1 Tax=Bradyrhizobium TaxID=374 RepID=UPI0004B5BDED|nr:MULTISPECIES: transporter [unclassified Bradyrhizobium]MDA9426016.1 transporter [Bradyrhizobium sp. CCBAU 53380]
MWSYALIPVGASLLGGLFVVLWKPSKQVTSAAQHLAAGVIFAAAASELLPDAIRRGTIWPVAIGAAVGVAVMLMLRVAEQRAKGPVGLIGAAAVDALLDGIVLGLGFAAGQKQGMLLAIALSIEFLSLAVGIAAAFRGGVRKWVLLAATFGVSCMVPAGSLLALPISHSPNALRTAAFSFGLVALLYLAVEELLVEAHEVEDRLWTTAMFFVGFIGLIILTERLS